MPHRCHPLPSATSAPHRGGHPARGPSGDAAEAAANMIRHCARYAIVATALLLVGCGAAQPTSRAFAPAALRAALTGSPPVLAQLHARSNQLLGGGDSAFKHEVEALRGLPIVVNVWASWCGPCRAEFPLFQVASARFGRRIAFMGIDTLDASSDARGFLSKFPVVYPSYEDPSATIAHSLVPTQGVPITVYIDRSGRTAYFHQGAYPSQRDLIRDIRRYASRGRSS